MSERDGWNHLYLYDAATGTVKNQITKGEWVVRGVDKVDEGARQIWFRASGMVPGQDPYFIHYYRINFDGTGLTPLTEGDGNHAVVFSSDRKYYVDTWSRVDRRRPSANCARTEDRKILARGRKGGYPGTGQGGLARAGSVHRQGPGRQDRHLGDHLPADEFRPEEKIPGHRVHLRRAPRLLRPQVLQRIQRDAVPGRARVHRLPGGRHGHVQPVQGLPRRLLEEHRRRGIPRPDPLAQGDRGEISAPTTSAGSASTADRPAARIRRARCSSIPNSTRWPCRLPAATTTGWTSSGGTSSGWAFRSGRNTRLHPTWTTPTGSRESSS